MSLKNKFIAQIKRSIINLLNKTNSVLRLNRITDGINNIVATKRFNRPILGPNTLRRFEEPSFAVKDKHNENIEEMKSDLRVINDTLLELNEKSDLINILRNNSIKMISRTFDTIKEKIKGLRRAYMINIQSIIEHFNSVDNIESISGATVDTKNGIVVLQQPSSPLSSVTPEEGNVKVDLLNNLPFTSPRNENDVLNITNSNDIQFVAIGQNREEVKYKVTITFDKRPVNQVAININNTVPLTTEIKVNERTKIKDQILLKGTYLFNMKRVNNANIVEIEFTVNNEDYVQDDQYVYILNLVHINVRNAAYNLEGSVISKELEFNSPITDIAIKVDESVPSGAKVIYSVADAKTPSNWIRLKPTHSMFEQPNWVSIGSTSEINKLITVNNYVTPSDNSESTLLYNILDGLTDENVTDGVLNIADGWEIDTINSSLQMGINDYAIVNDYIKAKSKSNLTEYKFTTTSNDYIDMYTQIPNETHLVKDNKITLKYIPHTTELIISDKEKMYDSYTVNGSEVTIYNIANGTTVYVKYNTLLTTIETTDNVVIELIKDSIALRLSPNAEDEAYGEVVNILFDEKRIKMDPNANVSVDITSNNYIVYISYDYYVRSVEKAKQYKTNVLFTTDVDIDVLPFNEEEIIAGNAHFIDGVNVSRNNEFSVESGWHTITTTQPYPTNKEVANDVNSLTNKDSDAGIILRSFDRMVAHVNSMRYVSLHRLTNVVSRHDHRAFTIEDGKVLINFKPDVLLNATLEGDIFVGRLVEWFGRRVNRYKLNPPQFEMRIVLKPTKDNTEEAVKKIKYRVELKRIPTANSPVVSTLELYGA
jgi:hypothetical protein